MQNRVIAVLSVISTVVVLVAGSAGSGLDAKVAAALAKQRVHDVPGGAAASQHAGGSSVPDDDTVADADLAPDAGGGDVGDPGAGEAPVEDDEGAKETPNAEVEAKPTKIEHVFVIALAGQGFDAVFGPQSTAPYLSKQLVPKGALLTDYRSLGAGDLADLVAMVGGQPPNADTRAGCTTFKEFPPTVAPNGAGAIVEPGCVFPNTVATVADQITASGRSWRGYIEDIEKGPDGKVSCRRPASNALDETAKARVGDGYATRHNPFVYFHSLLDLGDCDSQTGGLERLEADLRSISKTANYSYVAPNLCNDGTESPCVDGSPGGLPAADAFLAKWVPKILASPAYKKDGLLIVTFAGGSAEGDGDGDPATAGADPTADDRGPRNGTLLLSRYADAGTNVGAPYDPYSVLRSVQDIFALRPLAKSADASSFADTVLARAYVTPPSDD